MNYNELDTPSLLIDKEIMLENIKFMRDYAQINNVELRPHTKTHKMSQIAKLQVENGAIGIAVAKVGEAIAMSENGLNDIFIANEIVGKIKLEKIAKLSKKINISFGLDCVEHVRSIQEVFSSYSSIANVLIEIEVGENRSGVINSDTFIDILEEIKKSDNIYFKGIFSHDGNSYSAPSIASCIDISVKAQERTVSFANLARDIDMPCDVVSYGSTPTLYNKAPIVDGITELRPGTYVFMDVAQANAINDLSRCAAKVLATVMSKPTDERVILDVGAKGLTMQERTAGICTTKGKGTIFGYDNLYIDKVFDEHAIINNKEFSNSVEIGDKVLIIPNHICPVCNLYEEAYLISDNKVVKTISIDARSKLQ